MDVVYNGEDEVLVSFSRFREIGTQTLGTI